MSAPHPSFRIDAEHQPDAYVIRIEGELDLAGCPDLDLALREAEQTRAGRIILDLEQLTFIDSDGLGTLLKASRRSATNGNRLQLTRGKGHPADMFRLTALDKTLPLTDPALCPAIRGFDFAPAYRDAGEGRTTPVSRPAYVPDDANQPRMGEQFV